MADLGHFCPSCAIGRKGGLALDSFPAGRVPATEGVGQQATRDSNERGRLKSRVCENPKSRSATRMMFLGSVSNLNLLACGR
jgi:hypothetical protein